jgi:hypothetical protein
MKWLIWYARFAYLVRMDRTMRLKANIKLLNHVNNLIKDKSYCILCLARKHKKQLFKNPRKSYPL